MTLFELRSNICLELQIAKKKIVLYSFKSKYKNVFPLPKYIFEANTIENGANAVGMRIPHADKAAKGLFSRDLITIFYQRQYVLERISLKPWSSIVLNFVCEM